MAIKYRIIAEPAFTGPEGKLVTFAHAAEVVNAGPLATLFGPIEPVIPAVGDVVTLVEDDYRANPGDDDDILASPADGIAQFYALAVLERIEE
jgi:hypothetical protein